MSSGFRGFYFLEDLPQSTFIYANGAKQILAIEPQFLMLLFAYYFA